MLIRLATSGDLDMLVPLYDAYRRFYERSSDPEGARDYLRARLDGSESVIFLAIDPGTRSGLGFTQLYPTFCSLSMRPYWILYDLFVAPVARKLGVGRALMDQARRHAETTGASRIVLSTAHTNHPAQRLYESLGYKLDGEFRVYELALGR
jgi:GNAT superfamily N-acetyltransferase